MIAQNAQSCRFSGRMIVWAFYSRREETTVFQCITLESSPMCSLLETSMAATCCENNVLESGNGKSSDNPAVSDENKTKAEELKEKANEFFKKEIYDKAIQFYSEAIDCNPNVAAYYGNRSLANLRLECFGDALSDANKALALDKTYIKAYYRRASANMALGKHKEALKDFKYVVTVRPNDKDASARYTECDRVVRRVAFERAIASDDSKAVSEQINIDAMMIEDDYLGPQLEDGKVTEKFVKDLMQTFKEQKGLHKKHAYKILLDIKKYFQSQPSLVRIEVKDGEKFTVCGDIHGQFYDLLNIFEINGLPSETNPYLFNGDFVDRGSFSVECIFTLFSFKLLYPNHFFMARGNHESENMNQMYGFEGEVRSKFSSQMIGLFTEVFNWLPLAHCISNKVLVMHGGLSKDHVLLDDITEVDRNRQPPESGIMCDLLWSDPQMLPGTSPSKRGVGVQFGPNVTSDFLAKNGLDYIIRSHEVKDKGYEVSHDGKCVTVFSAPNYCDTMGNQGAFITLTGGTDLKPQFTSYDAVPHPKVKPMAYASPLFGLF